MCGKTLVSGLTTERVPWWEKNNSGKKKAAKKMVMEGGLKALC